MSSELRCCSWEATDIENRWSDCSRKLERGKNDDCGNIFSLRLQGAFASTPGKEFRGCPWRDLRLPKWWVDAAGA